VKRIPKKPERLAPLAADALPLRSIMFGMLKDGFNPYYKMLWYVKCKMQDMGILFVDVFAKSFLEFSANRQVGRNNSDNAEQENGIVLVNHAVDYKKYPGAAEDGNQQFFFSRSHTQGYP
jgi:hypothetical protein